MKASDLKRNPVEEAIREHIACGVPFSECMFRPGSEAFTEFYTRVREMRESLDLDWQDQELLDTNIGECIMVEGERVPLDVPIEEAVDIDEMAKRVPDEPGAYTMKQGKTEYKLTPRLNRNDRPSGEWQIYVKDRGNWEWDRTVGSKRDAINWIKTQKEEVELDEAEYQGREVKLNSPKRGGPKKFYVYVKNPKTGRVKKISWGDTTGLSVKSGDRDRVRSFVARHKCKQANDKMTARYWSCRTPRYKALGVKGGQWW